MDQGVYGKNENVGYCWIISRSHTYLCREGWNHSVIVRPIHHLLIVTYICTLYLQIMDPDQQRIIQHIIAGHNIVISGGPGTGKSSLIRTVVSEYTDKRICITGSTGMAAINVQIQGHHAQTIHAFAGLMDGRFTNQHLESHVLSDEAWELSRNNITQCELLIVDEASMVSARTFEQVSVACLKPISYTLQTLRLTHIWLYLANKTISS